MTFASETPVKSVRKRKRCDGCNTFVEVGEPAVRWAGLTDGDFGTAIYHPDCRATEIALNRLAGTRGDEWMTLDEIEEEDWQWLVEDHPTVAARMGISFPAESDALSPSDASACTLATDEQNTTSLNPEDK